MPDKHYIMQKIFMLDLYIFKFIAIAVNSVYVATKKRCISTASAAFIALKIP